MAYSLANEVHFSVIFEFTSYIRSRNKVEVLKLIVTNSLESRLVFGKIVMCRMTVLELELTSHLVSLLILSVIDVESVVRLLLD